MTAEVPEPAVRVWSPGRPVDVRATLSPLRRGTGDPAHRVDAAGRFWWSCATPIGDGTLTLASRAGVVTASAWGPGADWLLDRVPVLLGGRDDWSGLDVTTVPRLHDAMRRRPGMRLANTGLVLDSLVPAVLEQKVTGTEAHRAWRLLLFRFGTVAPGPDPSLRVPPSAEVLRELPSWEWHRLGVDLKRQRAIRAVAGVARRMEECVGLSLDAAVARLLMIPGIGAWTAAETAQRALGHPDALSVGDYHLPNLVTYVLTGRARGTDEQMLELLAPWAGQRQRVMRLIESLGVVAPRFGPRFAPNDIRAI